MPKWSGHSDTEWKSFVKSHSRFSIPTGKWKFKQVFLACCGQNITFSFFIGYLHVDLQFQFAYRNRFRLEIMLIQLRPKSNITTYK